MLFFKGQSNRVTFGYRMVAISKKKVLIRYYMGRMGTVSAEDIHLFFKSVNDRGGYNWGMGIDLFPELQSQR